MANPTIRFKRGSQSAFSAVGLNTGEPAFITDEFNFYIGVDGTNPNNKFFGSSRYWKKETASVGGGVNLFGSHAVGVAGTSITLAAPDSVGTAVTYTFPATPTADFFLKTNGTGTLSWSNSLGSVSADQFVVGLATFTNAVDFLLDTNSHSSVGGAVTFTGGVGVAKNLNVGGDFTVTGISTFTGEVTFKGGTINLGDANTDNVVFAADVNSNILPNTDATFDIGSGGDSKRWRHASFSGIGTFATGAVVDGIQIGITATNEIDTSSGNLILDSAGGTVSVTDHLSVTGVSTFTGVVNVNNAVRVGAGLSVVGVSTFSNSISVTAGEATFASATVSDLTSGRVVLAGTSGALQDDASLTYSDASGLVVANSGINVTGVSTFSTDLVVGGDVRINGNDIRDSGGTAAITFDGSGNTTVTGNLTVSGSTTQVNTTSLTVEDTLIELAKVDGNAPSSDVNKDIGLLFHYFDTAARLAAVYWDDSESRVVLASRISESSGVLTVDSGFYADVEFKGLFVTDTAGSGEAVISHTTIGGVTGRHLQNIIVDGGTF